MHTGSSSTAIYFRIADLTIRVAATAHLTPATFASTLQTFQTNDPGSGDVHLALHHHFTMPPVKRNDGIHIPWTISRHQDRWIYDGYHRHPDGPHHFLRMDWDANHARGDIYHADALRFVRGGLTSIIGVATDQILLARVLADRIGCLVHSSAVAMDGKGYLFVGHSSAGKSTIARQLRNGGQMIAEDRTAVRRMEDEFRLYSTWYHLQAPITPLSAPLRALCFIEKSEESRAIPLTDRGEILGRLLPCVIKPLTDGTWWNGTLSALDLLIRQTPAYRILFDRSGSIEQVLRELP